MTSGKPGEQIIDPSALTPEQAVFAGDLALLPNDYPLVQERIEGFMQDLYGTERYGAHNARILTYYDRYSGGERGITTDPATITIDRMTIVMHDFVEHAILDPEKTGARLDLDPEDIRRSAIELFNELADTAEDKVGLIKSYLFAIDASKWEEAGRSWRVGATTKVNELIVQGALDARTGATILAAVNKTPELDDTDPAELERVLKLPEARLTDLKLESISQTTLNHNIRGVFFKGLETLDLIEHPPVGNPASTWRDCIEAINFFAPALATLGYKKLSADLRGAALKHLVDDPHGRAARQRSIAQEHFDAIGTAVTTLREQKFSGIDIHSEARIKTEGSIRDKLDSEKYHESEVVPDGVGFAFIVDDSMSNEEIRQFVQNYMGDLNEHSEIESDHPLGLEFSFEDLLDVGRPSGYKAVHMTFYYHPADRPDVSVPFEVQVMTREQYRMKLYGPSSDLFYKAGVSYSAEEHQAHLERLALRARAEREMAPGSTIQSIAEMIAISPEIPSVFSELFRAVDTPNKKARVLVPHELEETARQIFDTDYELHDDYEGLTVIPPTKVTESQFLEALSMLEKELVTDKHILDAIELVRDAGANDMREDGLTSVLEGHLLPTALAAAMLAMQSGVMWDNESSGPNEQLSNIVTIALLHDYVEGLTEPYKNEPEAVIKQKRQEELVNIKHKFNSTIADGVDAMTLRLEIEDQEERREAYTDQILSNYFSLLVKPADRLQNHTTDIVKAATGRASPPSKARRAMLAYFAKTERNLARVFTAEQLPPLYKQTYMAVLDFAKHFGH